MYVRRLRSVITRRVANRHITRRKNCLAAVSKILYFYFIFSIYFFNYQAARLKIYVVYCIKLCASKSAYADNITLQKKNDDFYCRYDNLIMIELRNGQRWPNNNDDKRAGTMT